MTQSFAFHRPTLAHRVADMALGLDPLAGDSGVFLAGPRRTGKSTFLKLDLIPELEKRNVLPVYVDLWTDRTADPGEVITEAIRSAIRTLDSGLTKLVRRSGMSKVGVGSWLTVDIDKIGRTGGATITDAVAHMIERSGRPVVLIVDEAQHAITSDAGKNAMFALKSARDTLNIGARPASGSNVRVGLVFTGSHRDKLASLVIGRTQPFFGASVTDFPLLGRDFTDAYTEFVNARLAKDRQLDPHEVFAAFQTVGYRPEFLQSAIKDYSIGSLGEDGKTFSLQDHAAAARERYWGEFDSLWAGMTDLQRVALRRLIQQGEGFKPFDAESLAYYSTGIKRPVAAADVQSALDALRDKGLVVRLERGRYSLEDPSLSEWIQARSAGS